MELKLLRDVCGADCTLGQLYVDREFECYTVGRPQSADNGYGATLPENPTNIALSGQNDK